MSSVRTLPVPGTSAGLVVAPRALLVRGGREDPFRRIAPAVPVWRILVAGADPLAWRTVGRPRQAAGALVPPDVPVDATVPDTLAILHLDAVGFDLLPTPAPDRPGIVPLFAVGGSLRDLWWVRDATQLDQVCLSMLRELRDDGLLPPAAARDPRVRAWLHLAGEFDTITEAAASVGLSRARFHGLVRGQAGASPTRLRTWQRLRAALELIDDLDLAEAAATAGFADQAHLTRTCTRFLGTSPGRLRPTARQRAS